MPGPQDGAGADAHASPPGEATEDAKTEKSFSTRFERHEGQAGTVVDEALTKSDQVCSHPEHRYS